MEILSETTQKVATLPGVIAILLGVLFIFGFLISGLYTNKGKLVFAFALLTIVFLAIGFTVCTEPHRRVKVILQDDYPAVELLEKYDVVEQDGKILTLQEKEPIGKEDER